VQFALISQIKDCKDFAKGMYNIYSVWLEGCMWATLLIFLSKNSFKKFVSADAVAANNFEN
jgi:hypothetical protein